MIAEVNKLILNALIARGGIHLPDVGTLHIKRTPATAISRNTIATPRLNITFSTHLEACSIVEVIASTANIDTTQAKDIYERWLDKVRSGNRLTIDGVGTLNDKSFIVDEQLLMQLNPHTMEDITITRNHKRWRGIIAAVIITIILCSAGVGYYLYDRGVISGVVVSTKEDEVLPNIPPRVMTTPAYNITTESTDNVSEDKLLQDTTLVVEQIATEESEDGVTMEISNDSDEASNDWREIDDVRHYVVVGSYSTEQNAMRAISSLEKQFVGHMFSYFRLGTMYAVAAYGSVKREDCEAFKRDYNDDFKQSWIYTPRKYRE